MQKISLDGQYLLEKETAHTYLQEKLQLPECYGRNLDALYDCLTELADTEIHINTSWDDAPQENTMYFQRILRVFRAAARENEDLNVIFTTF